MPARRLHRIVQTYYEVVRHNGHGFLDFLANTLQLDVETRRRLSADPAIARAISYADPVGEEATSNVMKNPKPSRKERREVLTQDPQ